MAALCVVNLAGEVVYFFLPSNSDPNGYGMVMARMKGICFPFKGMRVLLDTCIYS